MRHALDLLCFCAVLIDMKPYQPLGKYSAAGQVLVILLQRVECLSETAGQSAELCLFLVWQIKQVAVEGTPALGMGVYLIHNAVKPRHEYGREGVVGVTGGVGVPKLEAL